MKLSDIHIGRAYAVKVSGKVQPVQIRGERSSIARGTRSGLNRCMRKFWGVNLRTNRTIEYISPARVRHELELTAQGVWREVPAPKPEVPIFFSVATEREYPDTEMGRMRHRTDLERLCGPA